MSLQVFAKTETVLIMCGVRDEFGVIRIPRRSKTLPGLEFKPVMNEPINPQILQELQKVCAVEDLEKKVTIEQEEVLKMNGERGEEVSVFLAHLDDDNVPSTNQFPKLIDVLREAPSDVNRKKLLKAFQFFATGIANDISAMPSEDLQ